MSEPFSLQPLRPEHATAVLAFERENRAYFAAWVPDRGDAFFADFDAHFAQLLAFQAAGEDYPHVLLTPHGDVAGRVNLYRVTPERSAELGYRIAQHAAGRGLATAAVREICHLAATAYALSALTARVTDDNPASRAVLERNAFRPTTPLTLNHKPATAFHRPLP
ncbi:GNAT family N-acetyltransferase [Actinacidiphila sp. bgisy144]|uniref:GNAT family N-acetyltransferase n=1 Tax=Actinacidiphila sp. bgisy144 TaxID=3413791 RepID=UPI003EC052E4